MIEKILRNLLIVGLFLSVAAVVSAATANGQDIFVTNYNSGTVGEYNAATGAAINPSLLSVPVCMGIALYGSDLFVTNFTGYNTGTMGEYTTSGGTVNPSLVSGLNGPEGIARSGSDLFVANYNNTIGEYTTSGGTVNASLVSGLGGPVGIVVSGSDLFVANGNSTIGEYTTSGGTVNASLVSGLNAPTDVAVSGANLFVVDSGKIGEYNATTGAAVNASLVSGLKTPIAIAVSGSDLFVVNNGNNTIGEYNATTGAVVNAALVSGLNNPIFIAITPPPVNGAWTNGGGGNWSVTGNWSAGNVPGVNGPNTDTATFAAPATSGTSVTVTLDTSPQLTAMTFSSTSSYVLQGSGTNVLTLSVTGGVAQVTVSAGSPTIATPLTLASSADFAPASGTQLIISGAISGSGGLSLTNAGTLILSGTNSYTGGTTVSAGTLQGTAISLQGSITNNATLVFNQATAGTYAGTISGTGLVGKSGGGQLTFASINVTSGPIAVNQGTLVLPSGLVAGGTLTVSSGATLEAAGLIGRAVTGAGTVTASGDLIIGNSQQAGQFNQGGAPGVGGTLNIGNNAFAVFSSSTAILGGQTNLSAGGSLTALNGVQLGNSAMVDATKVLTATGNAAINANFVNNGVVNGPNGSGQELTFNQAVHGAGSTTGNVEYAASYQVGNSPDAVSVQNVLLDPTSTLIMEVAGTQAGSGYDQLDISGLVTFGGALNVTLLNGFSPAAGDSFDLFNGRVTGSFSEISLPALSNGLSWNTGSLYTTGAVSVAHSTIAIWASRNSGNWNTPGDWAGGVVPNAVGAGAVFNSSTAALTVTLDNPQTVGTLQFNSSNGYTLNGSGTNTLTLNNAGKGATITVTDGSHVINAPVVLADNLSVSGSGTLAFSNSSSIVGSYSLTMNGAGGTLILGGSDTYTGGTIIEAGTLVVTTAAALPEGSSLTIGAGGTFIFDPTATAAPLVASPAGLVAPVPEPGTLVLLLAGAMLAAFAAWRQRKNWGNRL